MTSIADGNAAVDRGLRETYDIVVLDVMLPGRDGFEVCRAVRQGGMRAPILMLTARGQLVDRVVGLKLGADDYLVKPFEMAELLARLEALLRRAPRAGSPASDQYRFGDIVDRHRAGPKSRVTAPSSSSPRSSTSCCAISSSIAGATLSRDELLNEVWGYDAMPSTRTVDVHVAWLRQKLEENPRRPQHILTVHGLGYKFAG